MAARLNPRHQGMVRDKIRASQLVNRLESHVSGDVSLSLSQMHVLEALLEVAGVDIPDVDIVDRDGQSGNSGVYVLEAEGAGRFKIGWSVCVDKRIPAIQTGCPFPLKLLTVIDCDPSGEVWLHRRFDEFRVVGEWFELPERAVSFLCSLRRNNHNDNSSLEIVSNG